MSLLNNQINYTDSMYQWHVTYYKKIMPQCRLICQPQTYWRLRLKSFCISFPVTVNKNDVWKWSAQTLLVYPPLKWRHLDVENAFAIPWPSGGKVTTSAARNTRPSSMPSNSFVWKKYRTTQNLIYAVPIHSFYTNQPTSDLNPKA